MLWCPLCDLLGTRHGPCQRLGRVTAINRPALRIALARSLWTTTGNGSPRASGAAVRSYAPYGTTEAVSPPLPPGRQWRGLLTQRRPQKQHGEQGQVQPQSGQVIVHPPLPLT